MAKNTQKLLKENHEGMIPQIKIDENLTGDLEDFLGETEIHQEMKINHVEKVVLNKIRIKREKSLEGDNQGFFWIKSEGIRKLATENLVKGNQVYKEKLISIVKKGKEGSEEIRTIMKNFRHTPHWKNSRITSAGSPDRAISGEWQRL